MRRKLRTYEYTCEACGKSFTKQKYRNGGQKYCGDCGAARRREQTRNHVRALRERRKPKQPVKIVAGYLEFLNRWGLAAAS